MLHKEMKTFSFCDVTTFDYTGEQMVANCCYQRQLRQIFFHPELSRSTFGFRLEINIYIL